MKAHDNVVDLSSEPLGSRYIWPAPDILRTSESSDPTELAVSGLRELKLGQALCRLGSPSIMIFNALQTLTEQQGREASFAWEDIERELRDEKYGFNQYHRFYNVAAIRLSHYLGYLAQVSGNPFNAVVRSEPRNAEQTHNTGNPYLYSFNPSLQIKDERPQW